MPTKIPTKRTSTSSATTRNGGVQHDRKAENVYETKEAAFEAAVAAASLALRQGHEVRATAPARGLASGSRENSEVCVCFTELTIMSKETPTSDPRQRTDWGSTKQTDKPWKGNPEKEQRNDDTKPDLEKWQESSTH
jgi:hypothetical protein